MVEEVKISCSLCKIIFSMFKVFLLSCLFLLLSVIWTLKVPNGKSLIEILYEIVYETMAVLKKKFPDSIIKVLWIFIFIIKFKFSRWKRYYSIFFPSDLIITKIIKYILVRSKTYFEDYQYIVLHTYLLFCLKLHP